MISKIYKWIKDPWKIFSIITIIIAVILIILPQISLFLSSAKDEVGKFRLQTDRNTGNIDMVSQSDDGFTVTEEEGYFLINKNSEHILKIERISKNKIILKTINGEEIMFEDIQDNKVRIYTKRRIDFEISQETFSQALFGQNKVTKLKLEKIGDGSVSMEYSPGAYLMFNDTRKVFTFSNYIKFLTENKYVDAIKNSFIVTVFSSLLATVLAVTLAYYFARYQIPGKNFMITLITMASVAPPFLGGYAWRILLGSQGVLTKLFGLDFTIVGIHGVIWVITWLIFPLIFLLTYDAFTGIDKTLIESSLSLGATKKKTLFKIIIPLAMPGIITGIYMAMMTAFADFGTPFVISLNLNVLPVIIYKEYMNEVGSNFSIASTGSVIMIMLSSIILMGQRIYLSAKSYASINSSHNFMIIKSSKKKQYSIVAYAIVLILLAFTPHITVIITSFLKWSSGVLKPVFTLNNFTRMFDSELQTIFISFFLGISATILDIIFGVGIAYVIVRKKYPIVSDLLNTLVMIPYIIPGTVLGIGLIMIFNTPPIILTGTWIILVFSYFLRKLPYSVKTAEASLYQIHPDLEEAAKSLGAKPLRSFYDVTFKLMIGGIISGATLSFLHIMTEISSTIVLYRPPWKTMTAVIFENTTRAGSDFGIASAMTVILMLCLYIPLYFVTIKTRTHKKGEETYVTY